MFENDPEIVEWLEGQKESLEGLRSSAIFMGLVSPDYLNDPACWLQFGAAVCLGKPICIICIRGAYPPKKLVEVADLILISENGNLSDIEDELKEWMTRTVERVGQHEDE